MKKLTGVEGGPELENYFVHSMLPHRHKNSKS
jgi:hypothetical protein